MQAVLINIPCPNKKEAQKLCKDLLEQDLCTTAKIYENVHLMWKHEGKEVGGDQVVIISLKTTDLNVMNIHKYMHEHHSWGTPCVEVMPIINDLC